MVHKKAWLFRTMQLNARYQVQVLNPDLFSKTNFWTAGQSPQSLAIVMREQTINEH